ncbi:hypothetical protein DL240_16110 [Lujinxingia litoralis]|uniref:CpXC domain-containing protein n=1 Tax=Lujinxingia litoralis TaxID=2211119 RepID=A0A328C2R2_9DELT|nr:CpXC domain-containing protein [Lujinxingia litoralis]RAL20560.1 hypothetical protein DL240_16110 [Lujinxingia litoralis]
MEYQAGAEAPYQGHLGRTAQTSVLISSAGGPVFPASVYTGINTQTHPELRQRLLDGTLNVVECPFEEGRTYDLAISVIYHDEERRLFVLVIPETLRHEEFKRRSALLEELAREREVLPNYVRNFYTIFDPARLIELEEAADQEEVAQSAPAPGPAPAPAVDAERRAELDRVKIELTREQARLTSLQSSLESSQAELQKAKISLESERSAIEQARTEIEEARTEIARARADIEQTRVDMDQDRTQLNDVASRVERDSELVQHTRARLEEESARLEEERSLLEEARRALQVQELNLEQERLRLEQGAPATHAEEATQVVTDDQFIEILNPDAASRPPAPGAPEADAEGLSRASAPSEHRLERATLAGLPTNFDEAAGGELAFAQSSTEQLLVGYSLSDERMRMFEEAAQVRFLFQLHDVDGVPVMALTLAALNAAGDVDDAVALPLPDAREEESALLDTLAQEQQRLGFALYGEDNSPGLTWEGESPIAANIAWARERVRAWRQAFNLDDSEARSAIALGEVELVGQMRHPFVDGRFSRIDTASEALLAAGVVGYWSRTDQVAYLIGNRGFPLVRFREIQKRVARQALNWGIALGNELQQVAIDESIITDRISLTHRLLASFAELCVGVRPNDLDPIQQWENWDALIQLAQRHNVTPEPDVLELAELSLKRAQEYEDMLDGEDASEEAEAIDLDDAEVLEIIEESEADVDALVMEHRLESGESFFLVDKASAELLAELENAGRGELDTRLNAPSERLVAAQVLVARFGSDALGAVFESAETMTPAECEALARFVVARAGELAPTLTNLLPTAGAPATLIIARALVAAERTETIPVLLKALCDAHQQGNPRVLADVLAQFGDALTAPLSRALKDAPDDEHLTLALISLDRTRPGTLDRLASDGSKRLRRAAQRARELAE